MASVSCYVADHAQVDEPQVHPADQMVFGGVVQTVVRSDFPRLLTCGGVLGDYICEGFVVSDEEAAVAADGMPIAVFDAHAGECALEPDPFGCGAVLDQ